MPTALTMVIVIDNHGNTLAKNATGTIEQNSFYKEVRVPINQSSVAGRKYFISGYEGQLPHSHIWDNNSMYQEGGGTANAKFIDNPQ